MKVIIYIYYLLFTLHSNVSSFSEWVLSSPLSAPGSDTGKTNERAEFHANRKKEKKIPEGTCSLFWSQLKSPA